MTKKEKSFKSVDGEFNADSIKEAFTTEEISEEYTVKELRKILKENGLTVSGTKSDLIERVLPIFNNELNEVKASGSGYLSSEEESLSNTLTPYGINYKNLAIINKSILEGNSELNIEGFARNGLIMSDSTLSIDSSNSSYVDLKTNIPEVSYSDFESTCFTFKNLDLSVLPSASPQSLELSALMDSLEIISYRDYVNLKRLNLLTKTYPNDGVRVHIDIDNFLYPNFSNTTINIDDLDFDLTIGLDGEKLAVTVNLPRLSLINKYYRVTLSDLNLKILLHDLKLSDLDLFISISDFHYSNFDDIVLYMDDITVSLDPILHSNSFDVNIGMNTFDVTGISFNDLFPMLNIDTININPESDSEAPINMIGHISPLDITRMDLLSIGAMLSAGFDMDTYTRNMSSLYGRSSDVDALGIDIGSIFENFNYSSLDAIVLDLSGLSDLIGVDITDFGIDLSDYDLSAISLADIFDALSKSDLGVSTIKSMFNLVTFDSENLDMSGLISFDLDNFDLSGLLGSLNISPGDISGMLDTFEDSDLDLGKIFENIDLSCLDGIKLNLTGLIDSIGIDLSALDIALSDYDLSSIKISELMGILSNFDLDLSTVSALLKIFDFDLEELELSGLISDFDAENFDITTLLGSLNISLEDISGLLEIFKNSDIDLGKIFENIDPSILDSVVLNLSGIIEPLGIDLSALGLDIPGIDFSAIKLSDLIGILSNFEFDTDTITALLKSLGIDLSEVDLSGLIASFDEENFDISTLLESLDLSGIDIPAIMETFNNSDLDLGKIFENADLSCLDAIVLNLSGLIESIDIDLSALGIDLSGYDISALKATELIEIFSNTEINLSDIIAMFTSENKEITIGEGVTDATKNYYHVDCNVADVTFNEDTGRWEYQGIALKYYDEDKNDAKLSKKEVQEHNEKCKKADLDSSELDLGGLIASFDEENFDITSLLSSIDYSKLDIAALVNMFNELDIDFEGIFKNVDLSCLDAIVLDLTGPIDSLGIDLSDLDTDMQEIDLSAISLSSLIGILSNIDLDMSTIIDALKLLGIDLSEIDISELVANFDEESFDLKALLGSFDLSDLDIEGILGMLSNLGSVFENADLSCLDAIVINLADIIDSIGIDLEDLDIDLSDYDLSAISLSDILGILNNFNLDMATIANVLKVFGIDLSEIDLSGLIASFDEENVDMSGLLGSLDLSALDLSGIKELFEKFDFDFESMFENFDYSCLGAIELDLSELFDSSDIDLSALGIDLSKYDLSAISLSELIDALMNSEFVKSIITAMYNLFSLDWSELDMSGFIVSFDTDELDVSSLLSSLNVPGLDISEILEMFKMNGIDLDEFLKKLLSMFMVNSVPELTE